RTSQRQPVLNSDLWQELLGQEKVHKLRWQWVPGHADNEENNRCDVLAVAARLELAGTHGAAGS
ncbi:MAG TPA: RNase H family protein, partial [Tepidiformaceae bacterium]